MSGRSGSDGGRVPPWAAAAPGGDPHPSAAAPADWISGRSREEIKAELRRCLPLLGARPRDRRLRLHVAALQLRLGRIDEALVHYEGVIRGYVRDGDLPSAVALCRRILRMPG